MHFTTVYNSHPVSDILAAQLRQMPKVELHVHLEGATNAATVYAMAARNHIALPAASLAEWEQAYTFRDFNHFIEVYKLAAACMQTHDDYTMMIESYMREQAQHNIVYSELFLSTALHLAKLPADDLLDALELGIRRGQAAFGTTLKLIPDLSRRTVSQNLPLQREVLAFALKARDRGIGVGLGLGGTEVGYPPEAYQEIFEAARNAGLRVVAHGGETAGAASVRGAVEALGAERIGHGVRSLEDPTLVELLAARQITLEVSPHSNYCLGVVAHDQPHPIRDLVAAGVRCTVNSDNPPFFSTDLTNEYLTLAAQGFTYEELWALNLNALDASFLSDAEKAAYRQVWQNANAFAHS